MLLGTYTYVCYDLNFMVILACMYAVSRNSKLNTMGCHLCKNYRKFELNILQIFTYIH